MFRGKLRPFVPPERMDEEMARAISQRGFLGIGVPGAFPCTLASGIGN
jgi:hypothetical protein